jgi:hypothetical protein
MSAEAKLDLILSKLETIDARLRVLEERVEKRPATSSSSTGAFSSMF